MFRVNVCRRCLQPEVIRDWVQRTQEDKDNALLKEVPLYHGQLVLMMCEPCRRVVTIAELDELKKDPNWPEVCKLTVNLTVEFMGKTYSGAQIVELTTQPRLRRRR